MEDTSVLITGVSGFVGSWLAELCVEKGFKTFGIVRPRSNCENIRHIKKLKLMEGDIRDLSSMQMCMEKVKPEYVFHLASQSFVPLSFSASSDTLYNNIIGTDNVLKALPLYARAVLACSSEEYGLVYKSELPIKETNPLRPLSPYAVSKVATDHLGFVYSKLGKDVVRLRCFNTTGPRRGEVFVTSRFAKQIAEYETGKTEKIMVGNLLSVRDFTDVRDISAAYLIAAKKCETGEVYNVCSGKGWKIEEVLSMLMEMSFMTNINVEKDADAIRKADVPVLIGDSTKFRQRTGWAPKIEFQKSLQDLLEWHRKRLA